MIRVLARFLRFAIVLALFFAAQPARADSPAAAPPKARPQGVAVVGAGTGAMLARDEAFVLARAVYNSSLRPRALDELRARILAGEPAPQTATNELRELAELRAGITGVDAASRRLLAALGEQVRAEALLVVFRGGAPAEERPADSGVDAGAPIAPPSGSEQAAGQPKVVARLFLVGTGEIDAARYEPEPDPAAPWRATVASLSGRFPPPQAGAAPGGGASTAELGRPPPPTLPAESREKKPFYKSPWLWAALGAAALVGGFVFLASQDNSDDPIHLQMRLPR
jgi:hypothetical protein